MTSGRSPNQRRSPKQARSRATWEAIVEAASQILERDGPEALNTNDVAERAGVSIGTLYQYFPDKQAILLAAVRREFDADGAPLAPRARALLQALIAMVEAFGRLGTGPRAQLRQAPVPAPVVARRSRRAPGPERRRVGAVRDLLAEFSVPVRATLPIRARRP